MGTIDTVLASADALLIGGTGPFAEQVTYTPRNGTPRTIWAEVERDAPARHGEISRGIVDVWTIAVRNDATHGISATELNVGGDSISVAPVRGGTAATVLLPAPTHQDAGRLVFRINRT